MVALRSCCWGFTLAQGTIASGIVSFVESLLVIGCGTVILSSERKWGNLSTIIGCAVLAQGVLNFVATIGLFFAVKRQRRNLLLPWIVVRGILMGFAVLDCILLFTLGQIILLCAVIIWNSLFIYLFFVVLSYYQTDMERISNNGTVLAPGSVYATQHPGQNFEIHIPNPNLRSAYPFSNPVMGGQPKHIATQGYVLVPSPQGFHPPPSTYAQPTNV